MAKHDTEADQQVGTLAGSLGRGGRRGSVGSGLALMRSLSGTNIGTGANTQPQSQQYQDKETKRGYDELEETRSDLKAAFCVFDLDGDGFITFDEVRAGLKLLGETWTPSELRKLFSAAISASAASGSVSTVDSSSSDLSHERIGIDDFIKLLL